MITAARSLAALCWAKKTFRNPPRQHQIRAGYEVSMLTFNSTRTYIYAPFTKDEASMFLAGDRMPDGREI